MSPVDASDAYRVGAACVDALESGETKKSAIFKEERPLETALTDLSNIAAKERGVPLKFIAGLDGPTQEFVNEYIYLIGGPCAIPHYSNRRFRSVPVPPEITKDPYVMVKKEK